MINFQSREEVPFVKYTANGNNFVIVDETDEPLCAEGEFRQLAYFATSTYFGIGCDNLLVVQPATEQILRDINFERGYWSVVPPIDEATYIFRMFEPNGDEALCCGNGLMCIAGYLRARYGVSEASIITEIPSERPRPVRIGVSNLERTSWVELGAPRRTDDSLVSKACRDAVTADVDIVKEIHVRFRRDDLSPYTDKQELGVTGYLTFTGEPHLVVFPEEGFSESILAGSFFPRFGRESGISDAMWKRFNFGTWLLHRIGSYFNSNHKDHFPLGVSINVAQCNDDGSAVKYRCFERGINRETLACGTGALAVTHVSRSLGRLGSDPVYVLPARCRWYLPNASILITEGREGWRLSSYTQELAAGVCTPFAQRPIELPGDHESAPIQLPIVEIHDREIQQH